MMGKEESKLLARIEGMFIVTFLVLLYGLLCAGCVGVWVMVLRVLGVL